MKLTRDDIWRAVSGNVQPLSSALFLSLSGVIATLQSQTGVKISNNSLHAMPFGIISNPVPGVMAYILNLLGQPTAPIIVGHFDPNRPAAPSVGGTILYCLSADGTSIPVQLGLNPNGTLTITPTTEMDVICPLIKLGSTSSAQPLILGTAFQTLYNAHGHIGNLGIETGTPLVAMSSSQLSSKAFTEL